MIARFWDSLISAFCWWLCAAMPHRARVIPHAEDPTQPLLQQFLLYHRPVNGMKPSISVYLQHFLTPESPRFAHRHRWHRMRSFVLSGLFVEDRFSCKGYLCTNLHKRFTTYSMNKDTIHNVCLWHRHCWTVFVGISATEDWGYYDIEHGLRFSTWREHIKQRVPALEAGTVSQ